MTAPAIRTEAMASFFTKFHLDGLPRAAVLHRFSAPDGGDPHDHPWPFTSFVLHGGYREEIFRLDGSSMLVDRLPGASHDVEAGTIHRIVELFANECWTLILPGEPERKSGFYQFREDGAWHRFWDGDFTSLDHASQEPSR